MERDLIKDGYFEGRAPQEPGPPPKTPQLAVKDKSSTDVLGGDGSGDPDDGEASSDGEPDDDEPINRNKNKWGELNLSTFA